VVQPADLSTIFAALADPTRRAILARLLAGDAPVKDLAEPFELSGPAITKHLKVLERAGLISRSRDGQQRPCRLEPRALAPAADWIEQYRQMWEEGLDRLDSYLKSIAPAPTRRVPETKSHKTVGKKPTKKPIKTLQRGRHGDKK
jgi:DNA-binding transcriptional ArsR family regulator